MPISQLGALNTTALVVPDLYVQIVPPAILSLNGVPSNIVGVVGTATWGPVGIATPIGSMGQYAATFGPIQARKYDMGTPVATAIQQGAAAFMCVRATDGTDVAASYVVSGSGTCITFTALYTGTLGNTIQVTLAAGSKANTLKATVSLGSGLSTMPAQQAEVFDNIAGTGNTFWVNLAAAINAGNSPLRGPSQRIMATAGSGTGAATLGTPYTLAGGLDGASATLIAATPTLILGSDASRNGMYALRQKGCSVGLVSDMDNSTTWTTIDGFAANEGIYFVLTGPAGDSITNAISTKQTAGLDDYNSVLMFGDWIYWNDPVNGVLRLVSPQGFRAGILGNLAPNQSSLNKQLFGIVGSQKSGVPGSGQAQTYSEFGELQLLAQAGIDVICNPQPGGSYWGNRIGHNSSSNAATNGDSYTRMTNYIAATLAAGMGKYVGQPITASLFANITATLNNYLGGLLSQGLLGTLDGSLPYNVTCNTSNNPLSRTSLGYVQADVQVQYEGINEKFLVNLQGGPTVQVTRPNVPTTP